MTTSFTVELIPLNQQFEPNGPSQSALLINYSCNGACLEHKNLIAEPYVLIRWTDNFEKTHEAVLKLKWCRSHRAHLFHSGGRVVSMQ